jgi:glucose-6-phosphate 1-epimerase
MNAVRSKSVYRITPGTGELPRLELTAQDGARAEIYLHGAHITSWIPAGGHERLFLSKVSEFRPGAPIRGGIPVVFPQFGGLGPLPLHGFARLMAWEFTGAQALEEQVCATFRLKDNAESRALWPQAFLAELSVSVGRNRLETSLSITNTGGESFAFTAALHTYLRVFHLADTCVSGLQGLRYRDAASGGVEKNEELAQVDFTGEVNRIYLGAPAEAYLTEPGRKTIVAKTGFADAVVWNPGAARCAAMPDLEPDAYRRFVCVEAASVGAPVNLGPKEHWIGSQALVV